MLNMDDKFLSLIFILFSLPLFSFCLMYFMMILSVLHVAAMYIILGDLNVKQIE